MDLQAIWFFLWVLLWAVYFVLDGFDLGLGVLLPFLANTDTEKRIMYNAMGPLWDGNEVWLITAGGVTFAAFPKTYAVMFSALYSPLMILLFALILRGVSFEFRSKVESRTWRGFWDGCLFVGSLLPAVLLGVAFANIFQGIPIGAGGVYQGSLFTLLNPYGLLGGLLFLAFFLMHGSIWLSIKATGPLQERAVHAAHGCWWVFTLLLVVFLAASAFATRLFDNYVAHPVLFLLLIVTVVFLLGVKLHLKQGGFWRAWFSSSLTMMGATFYGMVGLFPRMLPSSLSSAYDITAYNASSTPKTLTIMLVLALIFVPIVLLYQFWAYRLFSGKVREEDLQYEEAY